MTAFEGNRPVPAATAVEADELADVRIAQHEAIKRLVERFTESASPETIGRRVLFLKFEMKMGPATQADLAVQLGVTPAAVSQQLKSFRADFLGKGPDSGSSA